MSMYITIIQGGYFQTKASQTFPASTAFRITIIYENSEPGRYSKATKYTPHVEVVVE